MITRRSSLLVLFALVAHCSALVPLIGWSNRDAFVSMKGSEFSSASDFIYNANLDGVDVIVVFKSPELSFDTLAKYGGVFGSSAPILSSLQSEMKSSKSSVWAGVEGNAASDLISTLSFILDVKPQVVAGAEGITAQHKLIQVELTGGSDEDSFINQDDVISKVMSALNSLPDSPSCAAIYTSSHTHLPDHTHRMLRHSSAGARRARAADDAEPSFCGSVKDFTIDGNEEVCILFCFTSSKLSITNNTDLEENNQYTIQSVEYDGGSCYSTNDSASVCAEYGLPCVKTTITTDTRSFDVTFAFLPASLSSWTMIIVNDSSVYTREPEDKFLFEEFSVPIGVCYACGSSDMNTFNNTNNDSDIQKYRFFGLQVQMFGIPINSAGDPVFGSVWNCQSYLTTVPLMGIFSMVILILILYCSIVFLFSIKSMDRFDDPRGPTISVENLH